MSKVVSYRLEEDQYKMILEKYKINADQIHTLGKTLMIKPEIALDPNLFKQHPKRGRPPKISLEEKTIAEVEGEVKVMTLKELKSELGIGVRNVSNKMSQKGLYFEHNLEEYLHKFADNWRGSWHKIPELLMQVSMFAKEELIANEISRRSSHG